MRRVPGEGVWLPPRGPRQAAGCMPRVPDTLGPCPRRRHFGARHPLRRPACTGRAARREPGTYSRHLLQAPSPSYATQQSSG
ncbi:hypothetical protein AZ15_1186 [Bordetella bronchiseptica A1-7]|nr:hypothetical protein AZ15_1186 [Bordetella bronchiseptica A1-7]KDB67961.1 hypothetical protein AZ21_1131 [Bordetella bronchiseptica B20-10725633]